MNNFYNITEEEIMYDFPELFFNHTESEQELEDNTLPF